MLKRFKITDIIIVLLVIVLIAIGIAVVKKKKFSSLPVEKETTINFEVFFRGITLSSNQAPFQVNDEAFITIRNVPYRKLKILAFDGRPRMAVFPAKNDKGYVIAEDIATPNLFDFIIKLEDKAKKTPDGYVLGGNKIKMGIPVVIEGENYKYSGTVSNVYEAEPEQTQQEKQVESEQKEPVSAPQKQAE